MTPGRLADLVAGCIGVSAERALRVAHRLRDAGMLPKGGPGQAPDFGRADAITLLVAVASGATLRTVAERTSSLLETTPGGANVSGAPLSIPRTAEIQLAILANMAAHGALDGLTLEIVHGWPEISLVWADGKVQRFQAAGSIANHQPSHQARVATTIPGPAFAKFITEADHG
ncbi:hypothetical protein EFR00_17540 [Rhizobium sophoriradicis]|uniref:hypothetical protein n=1 Tax=Rhizobium sophoriradicis TaxID=1535245 RepID=UPI00098F7CE2|nr:hypothetical protein [Rhizobium sophoriradicis]RSC01899.1 hypothetical protein EFR00_17540 [Rhizobium sophoriradicis]